MALSDGKERYRGARTRMVNWVVTVQQTLIFEAMIMWQCNMMVGVTEALLFVEAAVSQQR